MTISGLSEARSALRSLARGAPSQAVAPAIRKALEPLEDRVRDEAPVASGEMVHHVEIRMLATRRGIVRGEVAIRDIDYAAHVDLGTAETQADEFMQRAYDANGKRAADDAERLIRDGLGGLLG
jgi:HK97 gp10 family phage protein